MASIGFHTALGLLAGLIGLVVGLAALLLIWWQAPGRRDNQL